MKMSTDRALAVSEVALEWFVARVCRPEDFSNTIQWALEEGEKIVAKREREATDADED